MSAVAKDDKVRITMTGAVRKGATGTVTQVLPNHWLGQDHIVVDLDGGGTETLPASGVEKI